MSVLVFCYGFVGKALDCVISYLKERTQRVVIGVQSADAIVDKSVILAGVVTIRGVLSCVFSCVFSVSLFAGTLNLDTNKHVSQTISACSFYLRNINLLIKLAAFFPDRQRNALAMALSNHGFTTVTYTYTARLHLTSPVYSEYITRLPG